MISRTARTAPSEQLPSRKHRPDYGLVVLASILLGIGLIVMYSISPALAAQGGGVSDTHFITRQFISVILGLIIFFGVSKIPISTWEKNSKFILIIAAILSIVAVILSILTKDDDTRRWVQFGIISFQPVELIKFILLVSFAGFLSGAIQNNNLYRLKTLKPLIITLGIFAIIIVILQKDLGSAVVIVGMMTIMALVAGVSYKWLLLFGAIGLIGFSVAITSTTYRRERFLTYMQPERDCTDAGYQSCQALIAVGSGGLIGQGLGRSIQAYGYLPEAQNDSIFAIYAEKFGFLGVVVLIGLFGALLLRILNIMQRAPNRKMQLIVAGVFAWLFIQSIINIGAMIGLLPLKGITLPFISYGGTSLIFIMAGLGLVFQISAYTTRRKTSFDVQVPERGSNEDTRYGRRNSRSHYAVNRRSL